MGTTVEQRGVTWATWLGHGDGGGDEVRYEEAGGGGVSKTGDGNSVSEEAKVVDEGDGCGSGRVPSSEGGDKDNELSGEKT